MKQSNRIHGILVGISLMLLFAAFAVLWGIRSPSTEAKAAPLFQEKPIYGWYVCGDLGFGNVPGVPNPRVRLRLCHDEGWVLYTYCTQPNLPAPPLGTICERISGRTFVCGGGYQRIREYRIIQMPVDTPTPTSTPTLTATLGPGQTRTPQLATDTPVATQRTRVRPGGPGNAAHVRELVILEIGILLLSSLFGIWFVQRVLKKG
jgi:hypothetical protein